MKMDVLTATNGDALKCVIKKDNGFVNVKNPVPLRKRGAPLIPMKTWHFVCFPEFNGIRMHG